MNGATESKGKAQVVSRGATAVTKTISSKERRRIEAEERNKRSAKLRKYKSKVDAIEKEITSLEEKQTTLTVELEQPTTYQNGPRIVEINQELKMISDLLESRSSEWEVAQQELESHQS